MMSVRDQTAVQRDVGFIVNLIILGYNSVDIRTKVFDVDFMATHNLEPWKCNVRTVYRLLKKAMSIIEGLSEADFKKNKAVAIERMAMVYRNALVNNDYASAVKAESEKNRICGLHAAAKLELTGADGGSVKVEKMTKEEKIEEIKSLL